MGMSVVLKDQAGTTVRKLGRRYIPLVGWANRNEYPILGHVDPYGSTIYNRGQIETLLVELDKLRKTPTGLESDKIVVIRELGDICADGLKKPHRFLWFIGD